MLDFDPECFAFWMRSSINLKIQSPFSELEMFLQDPVLTELKDKNFLLVHN